MSVETVAKWNVDALLFVGLGILSIANESWKLADSSGTAWCGHLAILIGWSMMTALWWKRRRS